jgi:release factor glutamine methyltransferase
VKRRASGEPLQYILGETEFYGRRIRVDPRALIPRPETECLLDEAVRFAEANPPGRAADLGTGSGCLAVALAGRFPELEIDAVDCSSEALSLARENAERNAVSERIRWFREDMVRYLKRHEASLDLVLANPPYVSLREYRSLDRSVRDFEPRGALTDGADGTGVLSPLLETLPGALAPRGAAFVEFGYSMDGWVRRKARDSGLDIEVFEDLKRLPRFARLTRRPPAAEENRGEEV